MIFSISLEEVVSHKDLGAVPILILLNKTDKGKELEGSDLEERFGIKLMKEPREVKIEKVSAFQQYFIKNSKGKPSYFRSNLSSSILWLNSAVFSYYSKANKS